MRYAFYISGKSGRLKKFLNQISDDVIQQIAAVISDYPIEDDLGSIIRGMGIRTYEYDYKKIGGNTRSAKNQAFSDELLRILNENKIDYCISFGSHILMGKLLSEYSHRLINFHPAILPMFPGIKALDQAADFGNVLLVGNTAHFIDEGIDTGLIIMQSVTTMTNFGSARDYDKVLDMQIPMLNAIISSINNEDLKIINGKVKIENADYSVTHIYPYYNL